MFDYSIVVPVYYNQGSLFPTMNTIYNDVIKNNTEYSCEVIFIDDGSGDGSLNELLNLRNQFPDIIKIIKLTRNFGQVNALLAGYTYAKGKCVVAISADGQDPPDLINQMLHAHFEDNYEVVICTREDRDESFYRLLTSKMFYSLIKILAFPDMPPGGFDFILLGRRSLNILLKNIARNPFLQGEILWMGFNTKFIGYTRRKRNVGKSRWTLAMKMAYLLDSLLSYSFAPIRLLSLFGAIIAMGGFIYAAIIFLLKLFWGNPIVGWAPLMIVILVVGGFQMLMLGMIGEYLWRTLSQVRNRDFYIIEAIYGGEEEIRTNDALIRGQSVN